MNLNMSYIQSHDCIDVITIVLGTCTDTGILNIGPVLSIFKSILVDIAVIVKQSLLTVIKGAEIAQIL